MHNKIIPFAAAAAVLSVFIAATIFDILLVIVLEGKGHFLFLRKCPQGFHFPRNQLQDRREMAQLRRKSDDVILESHRPRVTVCRTERAKREILPG